MKKLIKPLVLLIAVAVVSNSYAQEKKSISKETRHFQVQPRPASDLQTKNVQQYNTVRKAEHNQKYQAIVNRQVQFIEHKLSK